MSNERPRKVTYSNGGQTKVTVIGRAVTMSREELGDFFRKALESGEQWALDINDTLCELHQKKVDELSDRPNIG